jgi:predicted DNA binding CopG/RHH family protein
MRKSILPKSLGKGIKAIAPTLENPIKAIRNKIKKRGYPDQSYFYNTMRTRFESGEFLSAVSVGKNFTSIDTAQKLSFKSSIQFGSSKREVKKTLGTPLIEYTNPQNKSHEVFFYKVFLGNYKARCEFHFFKDAFLVGRYTLSNDANFNSLKKSIEKKYTKGTVLQAFDKICLHDPDGNTLTIATASFTLCLVYVHRLSQDFAEMTKQLKKAAALHKEKKSLRIRIIEEDL